MSELDLYKRRIEREIRARKQAESILENKALELFSTNEQLRKVNDTREALLEAVTSALVTIFRKDDLDEVLQLSIDKIGNSIEADRLSITLLKYDENEVHLERQFSHAKSNQTSLFELIRKNKAAKKEFLEFCNAELIPQKLLKLSKSNAEHVGITKTLSVLGVQSAVLMPVILNDKLKAIIGIEFFEQDIKWSRNEESILLAFAAGIESLIERNQAKEEINKQKQFYENVLNSIPSDLVVFDNRHRYKFINPVAVKNEEIRTWMIGKDDYEYVKYRNKPKEIADKRRAIFNKVSKDKLPLSFEEKSNDPQGNIEWKHRNLYPVFSEESGDLEMMIGYAVDITDIKQTNQKLETTSTRLSTLISSLNSGILLEDSNRKILVTNQQFCNIFEIPAQPFDLVGADCSNSAEQSKHLVINPDEFVDEIDQIVKGRKIRTNEEVYFRNGKVFERDFIPIFMEDEYLGHLWEYREITEKKEAEKQLINAREQAEESQRLKQKFLANMSHEIRTPMNGVIGIVHLLERTTLNDEQKRFLNILKDSSEHLLHIINDILDVSKLEEGKLVLNETPIQIEPLIEGVVQNLKTRATDKKLELVIEGLEIFDSLLVTDPVRVRQILLNLLSNAIKFTHKGKIGIRCKTIKKNRQYHTFTIEVWDTGIGIAEENLESIFNAFDQSTTVTNLYGGTGLGLNIVNELVDKLGGKISVESTLNKGSTFKIEFTLQIQDTDSILFNSQFEHVADKKALIDTKILVVDDHAVNYHIASEILKRWEVIVSYAGDGKKALEMVQKNDYDLVLMDMQMPVMNGIEATKEIRRLDTDKAAIPIIAMTAAALPEERERCLQSGMNDYISKPYNPALFYEIISNQLQVDAETQRKEVAKSQDDESPKYYDLSYLKELSGNNEKFILEMVNNFKNEMVEMLNEMKISFNENDFDRINNIAHKAKSTSSYLGAKDIREILVNIEYKIEEQSEVSSIGNDLKKLDNLLQRVLTELKNFKL